MTIATTLRDAYNNTDPVQPLPAGDPRYVDCTPVRGQENLIDQMFKNITWSQAPLTAQLFTGHRGCGKSTELLRLKARLEAADYMVLYFEANDDLDLNDVAYTDLLLMIAQRVVYHLHTQDIHLPARLLTEVENWCREVLYTEERLREVNRDLQSEATLGVGIPDGLPLVATLLARVTGQIKNGHAIKTEIRQRIDPQASQLIANLNLLLIAARAAILKKGQRGLVIIVDSLDRIVFRALGDGRTTHTAFYVEHGDQLRDLQCHMIYTVPISLMYSDRAKVLQSVFSDSYVLPMIKIRTRDDDKLYAQGLTYLRNILGARMNLDTLFTPEAVDYICQASGGHPRDLMLLVRHACLVAPGDVCPHPITLQIVRRAEDRLVATYSRMIPENHYTSLARVYLDHKIQGDAEHELMLYNLSVLEYINGSPPWHNIHPAVMQLPKFQAALEQERKARGWQLNAR